MYSQSSKDQIRFGDTSSVSCADSFPSKGKPFGGMDSASKACGMQKSVPSGGIAYFSAIAVFGFADEVLYFLPLTTEPS